VSIFQYSSAVHLSITTKHYDNLISRVKTWYWLDMEMGGPQHQYGCSREDKNSACLELTLHHRAHSLVQGCTKPWWLKSVLCIVRYDWLHTLPIGCFICQFNLIQVFAIYFPKIHRYTLLLVLKFLLLDHCFQKGFPTNLAQALFNFILQHTTVLQEITRMQSTLNVRGLGIYEL
jgi:hypothetical protein